MDMIPQSRYRLKEYQISELSDGRLWWTSHSGFAMQIGGPCYIFGNVLLIGDPCSEENGFMKSEFLYYLKKLPLWNETPYYCLSSSLTDTATGRQLDAERLQQVAHPRDATGSDTIMAGKSETFQLGRYQISITAEGDTTWKSYTGMNQIVRGSVLVESDILFIGPKQCNAPEESKIEFLRNLQSFPKWNRTVFWCRSIALRPVSTDKKKSKDVHVAVESVRIPQQAEMHSKNHQREYSQQMWCYITAYSAKWAEKIKTKWVEKKKEFWNKSD